MKAIIKGNKAFCPVCEEHNYRVMSYKEVTYKGKPTTEFTCRCLKCDSRFTYLHNVMLDETERFVADDAEIEEVENE